MNVRILTLKTDDTTPYTCAPDTDTVISKFLSTSDKLVSWFKNNHTKGSPENVYKKLYPTTTPRKFSGNAKIHKLLSGGVNNLLLRPIASNIRTVCKLKYTINSSKQFVNYIKKQKVPVGYQMVPFDVTSLFTDVQLNGTIAIILQRIYIDMEIDTTIPKREMRDLLSIILIYKKYAF